MLMAQKRIFFFGSQKHNRQLMCHIAVWFELSTCQDLVLLLIFYDLEGWKKMCSVATIQASFSQPHLLGFHFPPFLEEIVKRRRVRETDSHSLNIFHFLYYGL